MRILVTGATGRVGSRLVPRLLERGDSVRLLVRQPERAASLQAQGAELAEGDLLQPDTLGPAVEDMDAVVHLAAFFRGATPEEAVAVNQDGTLTLAHEAFKAGVWRFVFASTNLVYGPGIGHRATEDDQARPTMVYPKSKLEAEQALLELKQTHGLGLRILRLAFVYGEDDPHLTEGMQWFRNWHPQRRFHLVHHADVAQAVTLALETPDIDGQIFNVADDEPVTTAQLMQVNGEQPSEDSYNQPVDDPDDPFNVLVSTDKIRNMLGFRPQYPSLQDAVVGKAL